MSRASWRDVSGPSHSGRPSGLSGVAVVRVPSASVVTSSGRQVRVVVVGVCSIRPGPVNTSPGPISVAHATSTMKRLVAATMSTARRAGGTCRDRRMARTLGDGLAPCEGDARLVGSGAGWGSEDRVERLRPEGQLEAGDARVLLGVGELTGEVADVVRRRQRRQAEGGQGAHGVAVGVEEGAAGV